jgi:hypothetical protein
LFLEQSMSIKLKKVTLRYSEREDRIGMFAELDEGDGMVIWLTLRICRLLVNSLCKRVEQEVSPVQRDLELPFRQQKAEWQLRPSKPVVVEHAGAQHTAVPDSIKVSYSAQGVSLVFCAGNLHVAMLALTQTELRQWLSMLYRLFRKAKWPMDGWPAWISQAGDCRN